MWRGSAAEYRHEKDNEIVCVECGSKRADLCKDPDGSVRSGHASRARLEMAITEHDRLEDRACELRIAISNMLHEAKVAAEARSGLKGSTER